MRSATRQSMAMVLLAIAVLFSGVASGNPGVVVHRTLVIEHTQYPSFIKKQNPAQAYLLYFGTLFLSKYEGVFLKGDTITNFKRFTDSLGNTMNGFRLVYGNQGRIDSVWQLNKEFEITDKAYNLGNDLLKILAFDKKGNLSDEFIYNYRAKYANSKTVTREPSLSELLREYEVYNSFDRNAYSVSAVWALSIGINSSAVYNNGGLNSESDARSYNEFFKSQFQKKLGGLAESNLFNEYLLVGKTATKEAIINALKDIAARASSNDYLIFSYSGFSYVMSFDSASPVTHFFPYDEKGYSKDEQFGKIPAQQVTTFRKRLISLNELQEYIQQIPAVKQLFISEAGPSEKFKTEFIRILMQNSPAVASLLNKNRIIIVPNGIGFDQVTCNDKVQQKGPINYFITSLDAGSNIYDLFNEGGQGERIAYKIKDVQYSCRSFSNNYFDVFFEKQFLRQYKEIFGDGEEPTRGMKVKSKDVQETLNSLTGKHYALVVGTDNYKGQGWNKLGNPVKDAKAIADELGHSYGFDVQLLEDKPMDTIYKAIREYYRIAKPNDQLVIYFAGHGDVDDELLDDGFIVCADSKSIDDDPVRNTYIPYGKLQKMLNNIPARQVLVLLDVCHGGTFDQKVFEKEKRETTGSTISNKNVLQFLKDKLPLRTRKFLSSVGSEPAFDGKAGRHSPFANLLLQVLRARGSGSNGIVTLSDINAVLQTASMNETATLKISPHMADFGNVDAFSEFIFIPVEIQANKE